MRYLKCLQEVGCDLNNTSPIQDWNVERLNIYIKELEKSFCSGSASKTNGLNLTENSMSPKRLVCLRIFIFDWISNLFVVFIF